MTEVFEFEEESTIEATFQIGVTAEDHGALYNRDAPNQHPISAITDLQTTLDGISGDVSAETNRAEGVEGSLENLTTTDKTNLVSAINEVDGHADTNATNLSNHIADKNNPHEVTKAQVGLGNCDNTADLDKPISTATQNALNLKVNTSDLGNAELDIQKNGTSVGKFTANASTDKVIDLVIPTQASDVNALPDSTKYGASLSLTINSSTFVVTAQLKDQDGGNLGSAQTIDFPLESVVVNGSYDSVNKKIVLTLENGNTIDIPVGDLVAGLQSEITVDNKLASDLVDDTNQTHKFATSAQLSQIATNTGDIYNLQSGKADKATTLSGYGITDAYTKTEVDTALSGKQDTIDSSHKLSADLVDDTSTTNKFVTASDISTWNGKQDALTQTQLNAVNSGITSAKVTQYDGYATSKANVSLDNLNADGQMIIDSQNGTISNCILEIPQNLKLELSDGVLTIKVGTKGVVTGTDTYIEYTNQTDKTYTIPANLSDGWYYIFTARNFAIQYPLAMRNVRSGSETPTEAGGNNRFFNTTDKKIYIYDSVNFWHEWNVFYPFCIIEMKSGVASFAKDSNGNDMIFNGAGFVGHHAVIYPQTPPFALIGSGFKDGKLSSENAIQNSLQIFEMNAINPVSGYEKVYCYGMTDGYYTNNYREVDTIAERDADTTNYRLQYVKETNKVYYHTNNGFEERKLVKFLSYSYDGTTVTDFTIRQTYEGARNLLTDDIEEEVATKQADVTTLTGYDASKTQTLKNVNGTLTWVDD